VGQRGFLAGKFPEYRVLEYSVVFTPRGETGDVHFVSGLKRFFLCCLHAQTTIAVTDPEDGSWSMMNDDPADVDAMAVLS
jgi:hypothetical protein